MRGWSAVEAFAARARIVAAATLLLAASASLAGTAQADPVLVSPLRYDILGGRYSVFAKFQENLQRVLDGCGKAQPAVVPPGKGPSGRLGATTRQGIQRALGCEALLAVPEDSPARDGLITESVWRGIMGSEPFPTAEDRANALVLSFEATDFGDEPEWNLCQDGQRGRRGQARPKGGDLVCYNESDPCSFVTWGPRGATAGAGREIQYILWMAWKQDPALLQKAFGTEYAHLHRFFHLKGGGKKTCDGEIPLKQFVCAVWTDPARRKIWDSALAELGHSLLVRGAYSRLYALNEFDGAKMRDYFKLWRELGLNPSEIDYAFFLDRATHLGGPPDDHGHAVQSLGACLHEERTKAVSVNGAARRCLARQQPHETQPEYRLARDVAYYLDAYPEGTLTEKEIRAWGGYVPLSAVYNFRLSDATPFQLGTAATMKSLGADVPRPDSEELTPAELRGCPASVLTPIHRKPN